MLTKLGISTTSLPMNVAATHDGARHDARAELAELRFIEIGEARRHLVPERRGLGLDQLHFLRAEIQQHGFLQPFVDQPAAIAIGLRHAEFAGFQAGDDALDGRRAWSLRAPPASASCAVPRRCRS